MFDDARLLDWEPGDTPRIQWRDLCLAFKNKTVVRRHPGWQETLQRGAVFDLTSVSSKTVRAAEPISYKEPKGVEQLPVPFPETAVLLGYAICVIKNAWIDVNNAMVGGEIFAAMPPYPGGQLIFASGSFECVISDKSAEAETSVTGFSCTGILNHKPRTIDEQTGQLRHYRDGEQSNSGRTITGSHILEFFFGMAYGAIRYINAPNNFIVCEKPTKMKKMKMKKGEITRMHARPKYIILNKSSIHKRYLDSQPSGRKAPMPHLRRAHYRTLSADRYKKTGRRVWVRSTNVNGSNVVWQEGNRLYKVV